MLSASKLRPTRGLRASSPLTASEQKETKVTKKQEGSRQQDGKFQRWPQRAGIAGVTTEMSKGWCAAPCFYTIVQIYEQKVKSGVG